MFISICVSLFNGTKISIVSIQNKYLFQFKTFVAFTLCKAKAFCKHIAKAAQGNATTKALSKSLQSHPTRNSFFSSRP
jgi:hypothetical protein